MTLREDVDRLSSRVDKHDRRLDKHGGRITSLEVRVDVIEKRDVKTNPDIILDVLRRSSKPLKACHVHHHEFILFIFYLKILRIFHEVFRNFETEK